MISLDDKAMAKAASLVRPWTPVQALRLVQEFGPAAFWMLQPDLIRSALQDPAFPSACRARMERFLAEPSLPSNEGACNPIFIVVPAHLGNVNSKTLKKSALREAFFLPLQWRSTSEDDRGLPEELTALARQVRQDLGLDGVAWGLWRNEFEGLEQLDLSHLTLRCPSAWGALASSLCLADSSIRPKPHVAVSAAWLPGKGIQDIEGISEKVVAAEAFGCNVFFTTPAQVEKLRTADETTEKLEKVCALPADKPDPRQVLGELLHEMGIPPRRQEGASLEVRLRYANGNWGRDRMGREMYILQEITADLAEEVRKDSSTKQAIAVAGNPKRAAIVASSPSAALLSVLLLRPKEVVILYTDQYVKDYKDSPADIVRYAERELEGIDIKSCRVDPDDFKSIKHEVTRFLSGESRSVVDITGGKKGMSGAAALAGFKAGAVIVYIDSENPGLGGHEVGTETMRVVAGPGWLSDILAQPQKDTATIFVTRHPGAREWATRRGVVVDRIADHIDPEEVRAGDTVIGSLPVSLAAEVCARGGRYLHLVLPLSLELRGKELTADEMERQGAYLREYSVEEVAYT